MQGNHRGLGLTARVVVLTIGLGTSALWSQEKAATKKESSPEAETAYADAANFQNKGAFDLATGLLGIRKGGYRIIPLVMLLHFFRCTDDYFVANLGV